jgi:hypothetical protein
MTKMGMRTRAGNIPRASLCWRSRRRSSGAVMSSGIATASLDHLVGAGTVVTRRQRAANSME